MATTSKVLLLTVFIVVFSMSRSQTLADNEPVCTKQGVCKLQLTKEDTTILGLAIGSASLKDVEDKLEQARGLRGNGDVSASNTICYVSPEDGTVLTFGAGPMGGFVNVTEFGIWAREAKFPNVSSCSPSKLVSRGDSTPSGIKLGLSPEQLSDIVGIHAKTKGRVAQYEFLCLRKMTADEVKGSKTANNWDVTDRPYFDLSSVLTAHFTSSGASRIDIAKFESY
jgi:hypothetical protein